MYDLTLHGKATEVLNTKVRQHKHDIKRAQDKMVLVQKHTKQNSARLMGPRPKSACQLGLLALLYLVNIFVMQIF